MGKRERKRKEGQQYSRRFCVSRPCLLLLPSGKCSPSHPLTVLHMHPASHVTRVHSLHIHTSSHMTSGSTCAPTEGAEDCHGAIK